MRANLSAPAREFVGVTFLRVPRGLGKRLPGHRMGGGVPSAVAPSSVFHPDVW